MISSPKNTSPREIHCCVSQTAPSASRQQVAIQSAHQLEMMQTDSVARDAQMCYISFYWEITDLIIVEYYSDIKIILSAELME